MTQLISTIEGLKPRHQQEFPLFEKTYIPPSYGNPLVSRIYADGSLYYLSQTVNVENDSEAGKKWKFISAVTEKGLVQLKTLLTEAFKLENKNPPSGNSMGSCIWKMVRDNQIKETIVLGIPAGSYKIFDEIDSAINFNIQPVASEK